VAAPQNDFLTAAARAAAHQLKQQQVLLSQVCCLCRVCSSMHKAGTPLNRTSGRTCHNGWQAVSAVWLSYTSLKVPTECVRRWAPQARSTCSYILPKCAVVCCLGKVQTVQRQRRFAEENLLLLKLVRSCSGCCCENGLQCSHCVQGAPVSTAIPPDSCIVHSAEVCRTSDADIPGPCRQVQPVGGSVCCTERVYLRHVLKRKLIPPLS
jgi:hypothetical protein